MFRIFNNLSNSILGNHIEISIASEQWAHPYLLSFYRHNESIHKHTVQKLNKKINGFEEWTLNENGFIQESKGYFDEEEYMRQLEFGIDK